MMMSAQLGDPIALLVWLLIVVVIAVIIWLIVSQIPVPANAAWIKLAVTLILLLILLIVILQHVGML